MSPLQTELRLRLSWWAKACIFALVVTNRLLNRLAEKGTYVVPPEQPPQGPFDPPRYRIRSLYNQGEDVRTRGVLFIGWDDGAETVLDPHEWTYEDLKRWRSSQSNEEPVMRFGKPLGPEVTREEFEAWELENFGDKKDRA